MKETFGQDLRQARKDAGVTLVKFAKVAGFSEPYLRSVENGTRAVTERLVEAYDEVLHGGGALVESFRQSQGMDSVPWTVDGTLTVLGQQLDWGNVDRRSFVTAALFPLMAKRWTTSVTTTHSPSGTSTRKIPLEPLLADIETRLANLWRLDDELGSKSVAALAYNELNLTAALIKQASYGEVTGRRMYTLAAEAARQVAWTQFDQDKPAKAAGFFETALRCSATASDPVTGAYAMSFAAVQAYSTPGAAREALDLLESATVGVRGRATPRMEAMLAARHARALSKLGDRKGCARMLDLARDRLDAGPRADDPPMLYWVTEREIEMIAGSSALDLGDPAEALRRFTAAAQAGQDADEEFPRSDAIYLSRAAEAHVGLNDLEAAVETARDATRCLGGVDSARSSTTLTKLRGKLEAFGDVPVVRDFLEQTA